MAEENKEVKNIDELIDKETAQKMGDACLSRIKMFEKMCKEYVRAVNGSINSLEMFQAGMDMIVGGFGLISRSNDMDELGVQERIACINAALSTIINLVNKVYLDPNVVAGQVAKASIETAQRNGVKFNDK